MPRNIRKGKINPDNIDMVKLLVEILVQKDVVTVSHNSGDRCDLKSNCRYEQDEIDVFFAVKTIF